MISKAIYNQVDQRCNLYEVGTLASKELSECILEQAKSVACLLMRSNLTRINTAGCKEYEISSQAITLCQEMKKLEKGANFLNELVIGTGTAFLIGKQYALTAAHCVCDEKTEQPDIALIKKMRLVFGFQMLSKKVTQAKFKKNDVYRIEKVVSYSFQKLKPLWSDWAILKLNREVKDRTPLDFVVDENEIRQGETVYMLGHPGGLPMKWTRKAKIQKNKSPHYFESDIDAFRGNSGSPVFLQSTNKVIGMLVEGNEDYVKKEGDTTIYLNKISKEEIQINGFEKCHKMSFLLSSPFFLCEYRKVVRGLNFEGICQTTTCEAYMKNVFVPLGVGKFNIPKEMGQLTCPSCNTQMQYEKIQRIGLWHCNYLIEGRKGNQPMHSQHTIPNTYEVLTSKDQHWSFLEVTTTLPANETKGDNHA